MTKMVTDDSSESPTTTVTTIEKEAFNQFQDAAFEKYRQAVLNYGLRVFREARGAAYQRDPDANQTEITTPDVEAAAIRTEMKLVRLRQLRFPFRLLQQLITLITGIVAKLTFDSANFRTGQPVDESFLLLSIVLLGCFGLVLILNHFEMKAEMLR